MYVAAHLDFTHPATARAWQTADIKTRWYWRTQMEMGGRATAALCAADLGKPTSAKA